MGRIITSVKIPFQYWILLLKKKLIHFVVALIVQLVSLKKMIFRCRHRGSLLTWNNSRLYLSCQCGWESPGWLLNLSDADRRIATELRVQLSTGQERNHCTSVPHVH